MMVFTFSKFATENFKIKCKQTPNANEFSNEKLLRTIDSFCFDIIPPDDRGSTYSVLSPALLRIIETAPDKIMPKFKRGKYSKIKVLFIDEAQDLNEIQYKILLFVQKTLGCSLHFIGDPNQNIYQFRDSFETFFLEHGNNGSVHKFELTRNFRCVPNIENFSSSFKFHT